MSSANFSGFNAFFPRGISSSCDILILIWACCSAFYYRMHRRSVFNSRSWLGFIALLRTVLACLYSRLVCTIPSPSAVDISLGRYKDHPPLFLHQGLELQLLFLYTGVAPRCGETRLHVYWLFVFSAVIRFHQMLVFKVSKRKKRFCAMMLYSPAI